MWGLGAETHFPGDRAQTYENCVVFPGLKFGWYLSFFFFLTLYFLVAMSF